MEVTIELPQVDGDAVALSMVDRGEDALAWGHAVTLLLLGLCWPFWRLRSRCGTPLGSGVCAAEGERAGGCLHEEEVLLRVAQAALAHGSREAIEQPGPTGAAAELRPVALPGPRPGPA